MAPTKLVRVVSAWLATLSLGACGEKTKILSSPTVVPPKVVSISLSLPDSLVLASQPVPATASAHDSYGNTPAPGTLRWTSSDNSVATVSASGVITGRSIGFATINADADGVSASLPIAVALDAPAALVVSGADTLSTVAGGGLANPPTIFVIDRNGQPVPGVVLSVRADSGAGTICIASTRTDVKGGVAIRDWTVGTRSGRYRIVVSARALSTEFHVTVRPDFAATMTLVSGDDQGAAPGAVVPEPLVVRVSDRFDNGVPGVPVAFESNGDDVGALMPAAALTDSSGRATTVWRLPVRLPAPISLSIRSTGLPSLAARAVVLGFTAKQVAMGIDQTCAIDLSDRVWCWANYALQEPGAKTTSQASKPTLLQTSLRFVSISGGDWAMCAIATDSQAYCWGSNAFGQLGDPVFVQSRGVGPLAAPHLTQISMQHVGVALSCGVTTTQQLYCWPFNGVSTPQPFAIGEPVAQITGGQCALGVSKAVYCWTGEYCTATTVCYFTNSRTTPAVMPTPEPIARLSTGMTTTHGPCAISVTDKLYCSRDTTRTNGVPFLLDRPIPLDGPVVDVSNDYWGGACAVTGRGSLYCWGPYNQWGNLGTGDTQPRAQPVEIAKSRFVAKHISGGYVGSCAIDSHSQVWCWGARIYGLTLDFGGPPVVTPTLIVP